MKNYKGYVSLFLITVFCVAISANAGKATRTGKEPHIWEDGELSVVIARVADVGLTSDGSGYQATIEPLALLAGTVDPSHYKSLNVVFVAGEEQIFTIHIVPKKGDMILAVLRGLRVIHSDACLFMPDDVPLIVLDGWGDKRIEGTLGKIRDARAHPDPDPNAENGKEDRGK